MNSKPMTYSIPLPYKSQAAKRKSDALMTINIQRNLHYKAAANFKLRYGSTLRKIVLSHPLPKFEAVKIHYLIKTKPTKGKPTKALPYRG
ncbi:MAG: hypothetical protein U9N34_10245, partial [Candidatus Cloacimonadota bacterium]|nr:hypothetical protein [Candidatus Cloacimonadota bacterium]